MTSYEVEITPLPRDVIDGAQKHRARVTLTRFDEPTSKGAKASSTTIRAWTMHGLRSAGRRAGETLMRRDQEKRRQAILGRIERIQSLDK